jgi:DNA-binding CsgD family transcriptional regulator
MATAKRKRSSEWYAQMQALVDGGYYSEAAALYDEHCIHEQPPIDAVLLRAEIHLAKDYPQAIALLNALSPEDDTVDAVRRETLLGEAYALSQDYEAADHFLQSALQTARALHEPDLVAAAGYRMGRRYVMENASAKARDAWRIACEGESFESKLNAQHLDSFILSREGRFRDSAHALTELLRLIEPNELVHMNHRAWGTHTLAILARELGLTNSVAEVERQLGGTEWPDEFRVNRFQTTKALGWVKALQGDYFNAFRYLKYSARVAPNAAWETMALCDRAYLAHSVGEERWSRQELLEAEEVATATNWEIYEGEECVALLLLAELFAPIDAAKASSYLAQFRRLGELRTTRLLIRKDHRFDAMVDYSTGIVDAALGNRRLAITRLQKALNVHQRIGYDWRAGRGALALYDLTGKTSFLEIAEEKLRNYSSSWLGRDLRSRMTSKPVSTGLTPMQTRIFHHLCEGMSNADIASSIGRSEHTVANHAKAVLKVFGVSSRSALIAEAMKRGLLQSAVS